MMWLRCWDFFASVFLFEIPNTKMLFNRLVSVGLIPKRLKSPLEFNIFSLEFTSHVSFLFVHSRPGGFFMIENSLVGSKVKAQIWAFIVSPNHSANIICTIKQSPVKGDLYNQSSVLNLCCTIGKYIEVQADVPVWERGRVRRTETSNWTSICFSIVQRYAFETTEAIFVCPSYCT